MAVWTEPPVEVEPTLPVTESARAEHTRLRRRMVYGRWRQDLVERVRAELRSEERADAWGAPDLTGNLLRPLCSALSQLYTPEPPRVAATIPGGEVLVDAVAGLWPLMIRVQRDTIALRECLVRVDAHPDPETPLGWSLSYRPAWPDRCVVRARPDAPDLPGYVAEAVLVEHRGQSVWVWEVSDAATGTRSLRTTLDAGAGVLWSVPLPLDEVGRPVVPYSLYHAEVTGYLWDPWEWVEIVEGSLRLGVNWTFFGHALLKASWPQRVAVGVRFGESLDESDGDDNGRAAPRKRVVADPAIVLQGTVDPEMAGQPILHQWGAGADLREIAEAITVYERRIAALAGLNPADIQRVSGDPRSGYAIEIARDEQDRARQRFEPTFRRGDLETLRVSAAVLSAAAGVVVPGRGYTIEYGPEAPEVVSGGPGTGGGRGADRQDGGDAGSGPDGSGGAPGEGE